MQPVTTNFDRSASSSVRAEAVSGRAIPEVTPATAAPRERDPLEPRAAEPEKQESPDTGKEIAGSSEGYRLNFDQEKRRVYLELLNTATGDVIQRIPRDDIAFATAGALAGSGVSLKA